MDGIYYFQERPSILRQTYCRIKLKRSIVKNFKFFKGFPTKLICLKYFFPGISMKTLEKSFKSYISKYNHGFRMSLKIHLKFKA